MATLAELLNPGSFADMRRMGDSRTNAELTDALANQARLRAALSGAQQIQPAQGLPPVGPFATMQKDLSAAMPQIGLLELLRGLIPNAVAGSDEIFCASDS